MAWTLGPTSGFAQAEFAFNAADIQSATAMPSYVVQLAPAQLQGEILEFTSAGQTQTMPVPIPRLAGLDELEVEQVSFDLSSATYEDTKTVNAQNVSPDGLSITYSPDVAGSPVSLIRIEIEDLKLPASASKTYVVAGNGANGSVNRVEYRFDSDNNRVNAEVNGSTGGAEYVHFLVRPKSNGSFGPPMAAAPYFDMPGQGGGMYGPALGGAALSVFNNGGKIKAVLILSPSIPVAALKLMIGASSESSSNIHGGLPNEVVGISWSANSVTAKYDVRPKGVSITASVPNSADEPIVSRFDTDPGNTPLNIDFAPVARSLLKSSYPSSSGSDLGLQLNFTCDSPANLRVNLSAASARYLRRPLGEDTEALSLQGATEHVDLPIPQNLKPSGMSFTIDGTYGPARLVLAADNALLNARHGFHVANTIQLARRMSLTNVERQLPLARVALFGRASEEGELLVSLHGGGEMRIGSPIGEPVSIPLFPSPQPDWHRAVFPVDKMLPPHPDAVWVVAKVTRGVFWWHATMEDQNVTQRSSDAGESWTMVAAKPALQLAVTEVDEQGNPSPLQPLALTWEDGVLNTDIVGVSGQARQMAPQFRRYWVAQQGVHQSFLDRVSELGSLLTLGFACRRDVELSLSNTVLVYNPWQTGET
jgi:hypothetical protein